MPTQQTEIVLTGRSGQNGAQGQVDQIPVHHRGHNRVLSGANGLSGVGSGLGSGFESQAMSSKDHLGVYLFNNCSTSPPALEDEEAEAQE